MNENAYKLGCESSIFFNAFIKWICDECKKRKIKKVFFLAREGYFFEGILHRIETNIGLVEFQHTVISVSRRSTFLASIDEENVRDWERYSNQYGDQPVASFFSTIGITALEEKRILNEIPELRLSTPFNKQEAVKRLLALDIFKQIVRGKAVQQRKLLKAYLKESGLDYGESKVAIVDIGWRGTIQDNLSYIYPDNKFVGYYLGLIPMINIQPQNSEKHGFINRFVGRAMFLKSHTQLEMLCGCEMGSVIGYKMSSDTAVPVLEDDADDVYSWNNYTRDFQRGVLEATGTQISKPIRIWKSIFPLTLCPNTEMARAFFEFRYSEQFGLGKSMDMNEVCVPDSLFHFFPVRITHLAELKNALNKTMWPQGYLHIRHKYIHELLFNVFLFFVALKEQRRFFKIDKANHKIH